MGFNVAVGLVGVWKVGNRSLPVHYASAVAEIEGFEELVDVISITFSPMAIAQMPKSPT